MSRSHKIPMFKLKNRKFAKKLSNKKVRRFKKSIANGKAFKKIFPSWDICDYNSWPVPFPTQALNDLYQRSINDFTSYKVTINEKAFDKLKEARKELYNKHQSERNEEDKRTNTI